MTRSWPRSLRSWMTALAAVAFLAACSSGTGAPGQGTPTVKQELPSAAPTTAATATPPDPGRLVRPIEVIIPSQSWNPAQYETIRFMAQSWEQLGVKTNFLTVPDYPGFVQTVGGGKWDAANGAYVANPQRLDPHQLMSFLFLCDLAGPSKTNMGSYCNPKYDALIKASESAMQVEERRKLIFAAQETLAKDLPLIAKFYPNETDVYNKTKVSGVVKAAVGGMINLWNFIDATPLGADKTLRVAHTTRGLGLNAFKTSGYNWEMEFRDMFYDTLARISPEGEVVPWAARSWESTGNTVKVNLRTDMKFSDGHPVTAGDVKFTYEAMKQYKTPFYAPNLAAMESVEVVDDHTALIHMSRPYSPLFALVFSGIPILPEHIWTQAMKDKGLKSPADWQDPDLTGSGPFILEEYDPARQMVLRKNPNHFHPPKADRVIVQVILDQEAAFLAVQKGTADFLMPFAVNPTVIERAKATPQLAVESAPGITVRFMAYNFREGSPFRDYPFRLALSTAIDYKTFIKDILKDTAVAGAGIISPANKFWYNPKAQFPQYDMTKARNILKDAGYEWDKDGRLYYPKNHTIKVLAD